MTKKMLAKPAALFAALALVVGLVPFTVAVAEEDGEDTLVVDSEPVIELTTQGEEPDGDAESEGETADETDQTKLVTQETKDVYIDNTVDNSKSFVTGVVEVTDKDGNVTSTTVYSDSAAVTYSNPRTSEVAGMIEEAVQAAIAHAQEHGYAYDKTTPIEPVESTGKVWDNREYRTVEDGDAVLIGDSDYLQGAYGTSTNSDYTRTHTASGDYGKYTYYRVVLKATAAEVAAAAYSSVAGDGGSWTKGSSDTLGFTFKRDADDDLTYLNFTGIKVDGTEVDASNYTAEKGSVIVTLKSAYLETLSAGNHTMAATFNDGSAAASFTIQEAATQQQETQTAEQTTTKAVSANAEGTTASTMPATGDTVPLALLAVAAMASACVLLLTRRVRHN